MMHPMLKEFLLRLAGVVVLSLVPVVLAAFMAMPLAIGGHPGEPRATAGLDRHMT